MSIASLNPAQPAAGPTAVPLFHAAWLFAAGIALAGRLWLQPSVVLIELALTAAVCVVAALRGQRMVWLPLAALWLLLGAWCGEMEPRPAPAPALAALSDGLLRTVEGTVIGTGPLRAETVGAKCRRTFGRVSRRARGPARGKRRGGQR
jgi:hypothetical protein